MTHEVADFDRDVPLTGKRASAPGWRRTSPGRRRPRIACSGQWRVRSAANRPAWSAPMRPKQHQRRDDRARFPGSVKRESMFIGDPPRSAADGLVFGDHRRAAQMVAPAAIPVERRLRRPAASSSPAGRVRTRSAPKQVDARRVRDRASPTAPIRCRTSWLKRRVAVRGSARIVGGSRLDDEQNSDRLVDFDHLPGQTRSQIAGRAVHHAQQAR